ncbi:spore coat protein [Salsuginibacillus kocurii]|uniref:spore coat protein n=1 Tax=Salsuginibacillus kocurii TaxID=427078 RepID=UPI00037E9D07|nr:spore coat protein [Salsuginibacillus kocurii]
MEMDYLDPENAVNMPEQTDITLGVEFLIRTKESVRNTAIALTECTSRDARILLRKQLQQSLMLHDKVTQLLIEKKWFHPYDLPEQYKLDQKAADQTKDIAQMTLFPEDTSRKGMFDRSPDQ